jgi:hypothetical protein
MDFKFYFEIYRPIKIGVLNRRKTVEKVKLVKIQDLRSAKIFRLWEIIFRPIFRPSGL